MLKKYCEVSYARVSVIIADYKVNNISLEIEIEERFWCNGGDNRFYL